MLNLRLPRLWLYFARTIAHLRPIQLRYQIWRRVRRNPAPPSPDILGSVRRDLRAPQFLKQHQPNVGPDRIVFLNVERPLPNVNVDWHPRDASKLWRYNLHYFDFLHWDCYPRDKKESLIRDWIRKNPFGEGDGWEPYTCSCRIINWVKFFLETGKETLQPAISASLATQIRWLEGNLEFHLLGNHLLKNAEALVFGGAIFASDAASRCLQKGLDLFLAQAREQFLNDGGHFERSPQYHSICLQDCLDIAALLKSNPELSDKSMVAEVCQIARKAASFLSTLVAADHQIPLFNDSAFNVAAGPRELLRYARNLTGPIDHKNGQQLTRIYLPDSGYFGQKSAGDSMVIDCGPIGPNYQPGHSHCDTLSYELCIDGRRVIVDSGVFDYDQGEMRDYVRSTCAHNTVRIDQQEQSEMWGAFRVARRAYPIAANLSDGDPHSMVFRGAHNGYHRIPGKPTHEREVTMEKRGVWRIEDRITGKGSHLIESFINFHPDVIIQRTSDKEFRLLTGRTELASLKVLRPCGIRRDTGWYCPEFGLRYERDVLVLYTSGPLPAYLSYEVRKSA